MGVENLYNGTVDIFERLDKKFPDYIAYCYAVVSIFFLALQSLVVKMNTQLGLFELMYFRTFLVISFNLFQMKMTKESPYLSDSRTFTFAVLRSVCSSSFSILFFFASRLISLGEATILFQTSPIWSPFVAFIFFGERFCFMTLLYSCISFVSIIFILKPPFLFSSEDSTETYDFQKLFGQCISIISAIMYAVTNNINKVLKDKISKAQLLFYLQTGGLAINGILKIIFESAQLEIFTIESFAIVIMFAVVSFIAQLTGNHAMFLKGANKIMPFNYTQVLFALIFDFVLFHKTIDFTQSIAGCVIIFCCLKIATLK